jgi:oxalate decarboxylase
MSNVQRRDFLVTGLGVTTAALTSSARAAAQEPSDGPVRGKEGALILGPANPAREAQSRDRLAPPATDRGTLPNLRWSFADSHNRLQQGGWARQATRREMPVATVSLRQWLAFTPYEMVRAHLNIDRSVLASIPLHKTPVVPG